MKGLIQKTLVKWAGTVIGAAAGVLATWGLVLPQDWEATATLALAGVLMAVATKLADWLVGLLPIDIEELT